MRRSKRHKNEVDLALQQMSTPFGKSLAARNKAETYPAHLPIGVAVGTHGNTTGNVAEVSHRLLEAARKTVSLFTSMRAAVARCYTVVAPRCAVSTRKRRHSNLAS